MDFYAFLYKLKKIVGSNNFSAQFIKIISHYKKIGYNINVLQQTACLVDLLWIVFVIHAMCLSMLSRLFIAALWSPAGKGLASWLLFVMFGCVFVTFPCGILGQVWYLIVLISDLCRLSYFQ